MPVQSRVFSDLEKQNGILDGFWQLAISFLKNCCPMKTNKHDVYKTNLDFAPLELCFWWFHFFLLTVNPDRNKHSTVRSILIIEKIIQKLKLRRSDLLIVFNRQ